MVVQLRMIIPNVLLAGLVISCSHLPLSVSRIAQMDIMRILQHVPAISVKRLVQFALMGLFLHVHPAIQVITFNLLLPHVHTLVPLAGH